MHCQKRGRERAPKKKKQTKEKTEEKAQTKTTYKNKKTKRTKWNFSNVLEANCVKPETENVSARQIESVSKLKLLLGFQPPTETETNNPHSAYVRVWRQFVATSNMYNICIPIIIIIGIINRN